MEKALADGALVAAPGVAHFANSRVIRWSMTI